MSDQGTETQNEFLGELVGEGKKYKDVEELAKGYVNADNFITTLKTEKQEVEEQLLTVKGQEDQLSNIVELLKPKEEPIIEEPTKVKEEVVDTKPIPEPTVSNIGAELNSQEFAKLAVAKYGDATTAGNKLKEYIGDDVAKQEMVLTIMRTDPSALVNILPNVDEQKTMNPTSGTSMTAHQGAQLPMTNTEAMRVFNEDRQLYRSRAFQDKLTAGQLAARAAGIKFENT